jgi:hypothetical protein
LIAHLAIPYVLLRGAWHKAELDIPQVGDDIANHDEPVVLHMNLQVVAEVRALGKEHEVGKRIGARDNLGGLLLGNTEFRGTIPQRHGLGRKGSFAGEGERASDVLDVNRLRRQQRHVAANLLEVERRHGNPCGKLSIEHLDIRLIAIQEVELIPNATLLLAVLQRDGQVVGLRLGDAKRNRIVIRHRLHDAIEVVGIEPNIKLGSRMVVFIVFKLIGEESHVGKHCAGVIHCNHTDAILVEDEAHLDKHGFETLSESPNGSRLDRLGYHNVVAHFVYPLGETCKLLYATAIA